MTAPWMSRFLKTGAQTGNVEFGVVQPELVQPVAERRGAPTAPCHVGRNRGMPLKGVRIDVGVEQCQGGLELHMLGVTEPGREMGHRRVFLVA